MSLLALPAVVLSATPASAEPCGLIVNSSITLTGDITGCTGTAITVLGNNLVLDLGGRTVACRPGVPGEGPGIYVPNRTGVTIRNGTVRDCDTGIYLEQGGRHTLTNLLVTENIGFPSGAGIFGEGIQLYGSNDNRIVANRVIHNGTFAGIDMFDSSRNLVQSNVVDRNNVVQVDPEHGHPPTPTIMQDIGIWVVALGDFPGPVTGNLITENQVTNNGLDGVQLATGTTGNTVTRNNIVRNGFGQVQGIRNGDGVAVFGQSSVISNNQVFQNGGNGIFVRINRRNHQILNNQTGGNGQVPGPSAQFDLRDDNPACDNNVWRGNTGTRNQPCIL